MVKLPQHPLGQLQRLPEDLRTLSGRPIWRVHRTSGAYVIPWNQLRHYGPIDTMRFDHHDPPPHTQAKGISYNALDVPTVLAEVFQQTRVINRTKGDPYLTGWTPTRDLALLDLTGNWPIRNGASYTINTGRKDHCRAWARAITAAWPDLDGLWHNSSVTGQTVVTLFETTADAFPTTPIFSNPLTHAGLFSILSTAAAWIGYTLL